MTAIGHEVQVWATKSGSRGNRHAPIFGRRLQSLTKQQLKSGHVSLFTVRHAAVDESAELAPHPCRCCGDPVRLAACPRRTPRGRIGCGRL